MVLHQAIWRYEDVSAGDENGQEGARITEVEIRRCAGYFQWHTEYRLFFDGRQLQYDELHLHET